MASADPLSDADWAFGLGRGLRAMRASDHAWRLRLIDGPNMSNLGAGGRDPRTYGTVASLDELQGFAARFVEGLGAKLTTYHSNHEGDIVGHVYATMDETDAYIINPAASTRRGAPIAAALADSRRPYVEVHFSNIAAVGWLEGAAITRAAAGVAMGLRRYSYLSAAFGVVGLLDSAAVA